MTNDSATRVWHCTTPLKVEIGAVTSTIGAVTSTEELAWISMDELVSVITQPWACRMVISDEPSSSTTSCPDGVLTVTFGEPLVSSNSSTLPARECNTLMLLDDSAACGSFALPFQALPMM